MSDDIGDEVLGVVPVGDHAVLVEVAGPEEAADLASRARVHGVEATEVVPAASTVLFDGVDPDRLVRQLRGMASRGDADAPREVVIPVDYDGPDLLSVAELWGCSADEVGERHSSRVFTAAFCGFSPGFAYLVARPALPPVPRLASPRTRVPRGAVAVADSWSGIYPTESPGGWRIIGRTEAALWDVGQDPPALIVPGARVRFEPR